MAVRPGGLPLPDHRPHRRLRRRLHRDRQRTRLRIGVHITHPPPLFSHDTYEDPPPTELDSYPFSPPRQIHILLSVILLGTLIADSDALRTKRRALLLRHEHLERSVRRRLPRCSRDDAQTLSTKAQLAD